VAELTHGEAFYSQDSEFAAFRVFPGQEDLPKQRFGGWSLDTTLYAVPETPSLMPTPLGNIRLSFATDDGLVRWRIETEGWEVTIGNDEGPSVEPDITRQNRLTDLPKDIDALVALLVRQTEGQSEFSIETTLPGSEAQAARAERASRIAANRPRYLAQLRASSPDLARALVAMRSRIADQFGKLSGAPCMPPQCVY